MHQNLCRAMQCIMYRFGVLTCCWITASWQLFSSRMGFFFFYFFFSVAPFNKELWIISAYFFFASKGEHFAVMLTPPKKNYKKVISWHLRIAVFTTIILLSRKKEKLKELVNAAQVTPYRSQQGSELAMHQLQYSLYIFIYLTRFVLWLII